MTTIEKKKLLLQRLEQLEKATLDEYFKLTNLWALNYSEPN